MNETKNKIDVMIVISEYLPEFVDGRINRMRSLEEYLAKKGKSYHILSSGRQSSLAKYKKYGFALSGLKKTGRGEVRRLKKVTGFMMLLLVLKLKFLFYKIIIFDKQIINTFNLYFKVNGLIKINHYSLILVSVPKFSTLVPFYFVKMPNSDVILDFRDLPFKHKIIVPNLLSRVILDLILKRFVSLGYTFWVTTLIASNELRQRLGPNAVIKVVPNGYDQLQTTKTLTNHQKYSLGYFGNIGGARSIEAQLVDLIHHFPDVAFWGHADAITKELLGPRFLGNLKRGDLHERMMSCKLLLLIITENEDASCAIPGKLYEYISTSKPIVYIGPSASAAYDLLEDLKYPFFHLKDGKIIDRTHGRIVDFKKVNQFKRSEIWAAELNF